MITFSVVKERHGWAIRLGERMTTPFRLRELAIREAKCLADAIRCHGECAEVVVEGDEENARPDGMGGVSSTRLVASGRWRGAQ